MGLVLPDAHLLLTGRQRLDGQMGRLVLTEAIAHLGALCLSVVNSSARYLGFDGSGSGVSLTPSCCGRPIFIESIAAQNCTTNSSRMKSYHGWRRQAGRCTPELRNALSQQMPRRPP